MPVYLGKLVKSNTPPDYVCQIYGPAEIETAPSPADYAFGAFVRIPLGGDAGHLVGLIYDTILLNPDFGNLGPRLSPAPDLAVFSPDYLAEKVTLVGITALGASAPDGAATHGVPPLAAQIDVLVERMDDETVRQFHRAPDGEIRIGYAPLLLSLDTPLARRLVLCVIDRLQTLFPEQTPRLDVLRGELAWQTAIGPLGGGR
jgi:hypothetical protein